MTGAILLTLLAVLTQEAAAPGPPAASEEAAPAQSVSSTDTASLEGSLARVSKITFMQPVVFPAHELEVVGSTEADESAEMLLQQMSGSSEEKIRLRAIEGWSQQPAAVSLEPLFQLLLDQSAEVRNAAAQALAAGSGAPAAERVLDLLLKQDPVMLASAEQTLPFFMDTLGPLCLDQLNGGDLEKARAAAYALGVMRYLPAAGALAQGAWSPDSSLARTCVTALNRLNSGETMKEWPKLVQHPDPEVCGMALRALRTHHSREGREILFNVASGQVRPEPPLQLLALKAVRSWPAQDSIPALIRIMGMNPRVAPFCSKYLTELTKQDFGGSAQLWAQWWEKVNAPAPSTLPPGAQASEQAK